MRAAWAGEMKSGTHPTFRSNLIKKRAARDGRSSDGAWPLVAVALVADMASGPHGTRKKVGRGSRGRCWFRRGSPCRVMQRAGTLMDVVAALP